MLCQSATIYPYFHPTCALEVTKVSLFIVISTRLAPSKLPKCRCFRVTPPVLRPRSYQGAAIFLPPICALEVSVPLACCALEVTKVSLFIGISTRRPRSFQSVATLVFPSRLAPSKLPKCWYFSFFPPDLRHTCSLVETKVSLLSCSPPLLRPRSYQSVLIHHFFHPTCALEVTKVSLLSCSPPALRPRSS